MAYSRCDYCDWPYLVSRKKLHEALHPFLPDWPCVLPLSLPLGIEANQFPLHLVGVLFNGIFCLQPDRQVLIERLGPLIATVSIDD